MIHLPFSLKKKDCPSKPIAEGEEGEHNALESEDSKSKDDEEAE